MQALGSSSTETTEDNAHLKSATQIEMASNEYLHAPVPPPHLNVPSGSTVQVSIIDTTGSFQVPMSAFAYPPQIGHEFLKAPVYSFLIENGSHKVIFDLGARKDWQNLAPVVVKSITSPGWKIDIKKNVSEILQDAGIDVAGGAIEAMIWSHWHWDHIGDTTTFPESTTLVMGAGVQEAFLPGYPKNPDSPLLESDFADRKIKVIDFESSSLKIGRFRAHNYFGDGSFYLLDAPGHAIGNMCALARVTSDCIDTFVFLGGDVAHHGALFRPTKYLPLPTGINPSPLKRFLGVCPGHLFEDIHPKKCGNAPFYKIIDSAPHNATEADESLGVMEEFDAAENVLVMVAHDASLVDPEVGMEWFPNGTLADWKKRDIAKKARWIFLRDFGEAIQAKTEA